MGVQYQISPTNSKYLIPDGNGNIDVVNDFSWTLSPKSARGDVPYIQLVEYQQTAGQLIASMIYFSRLATNAVSDISTLITAPKNPGDVYQLKYIAEPTGFVYKFPYFNSKKTSRSTSFEYEDGQSPFSALLQLGRRVAGERYKGGGWVGEFFGKLPALAEAGIGTINTLLPGKLTLENPKSWVGTDEGEYTFTIDLINTGDVSDIQQNRDLCHILKYQQSPNRRFVITDPVCIYSVYSPDIVAMPAAIISNLDITNLGNTRKMNLNGIERIVPEAYRLHISLRNLFMPSRNVEGKLDSGQATVGITTPADAQKILNSLPKDSILGTFAKENPNLIKKATNLTGA